MNSSNSIGGYFELELNKGALLHADAILLNSGRSCLEYILRAKEITNIYLPKFICDAVIRPLDKLGITYTFYAIDNKLEMKDDIVLKESELLLYVNYFGIKNTYSASLSDKYGQQFVLDCSQAYYFPALEKGYTFYSSRKFFGVPDGGELITDNYLQEEILQDTSYGRTAHLVMRIDLDAESAYGDFINNETAIQNAPMMRMSRLTQKILENVQMDDARQQRNKNFRLLHEALGEQSHLEIDVEAIDGPLCYPFWTGDSSMRQRLIDRKIFVPTYWPNVIEWCEEQSLEYQLATQVIPLPIDQRYGEGEMTEILEIINAH